MFQKLRHRFLLVNLVSISLIMLLSFATIYMITYQNVHSDINAELQQVADFYLKPDMGLNGPHAVGSRHNQPLKGNAGPPPERSVSFLLQADTHWNLIAHNSRFDMDDDFYAQALKKSESSTVPARGQFVLEGTRWAYTVEQNSAGYSVVYLDVTARQQILTNLIYTFSIVGLVMLVVIYLMSRFFANRSIAPVKVAFERQKQFIADASHELKTPLAVINTNADVLLANQDDTIVNQVKWLHHIKSETERMKTLTGDLLYLTELDEARTGVLFTTFNLSEAVESVLLTMEAVIFEKEIALKDDIESDLTLHGNSEQIKQVVMILLDNAAKYTNPGGSISLSLKKHHNEIHLTVANTGEGIPPENLERIFDRFYRVDASRSRKLGGYGLGLAIAKSIIEQHKGKISAKSIPGETTSFTVQF
ncbi:sensor histidine kinase [Gorillibacterium massiliense]|uniref:sensor histidine kinase n=1 Tax=Gorillibacterium massiliense TaxID=1280390 RepID=UPI0004B62A3C|nr:HAMP domain-containing sensor histidine kinase [Gorillibacterium massiliense]